jgi:hypothetical protein
MRFASLVVACTIVSSLLVFCTGDNNPCTATGGQCVSAPGLGAGTCADNAYNCPADPTWGNASCLFPLSSRCKSGKAFQGACTTGWCFVSQAGSGHTSSCEAGAEAPPCSDFVCCVLCEDTSADGAAADD